MLVIALPGEVPINACASSKAQDLGLRLIIDLRWNRAFGKASLFGTRDDAREPFTRIFDLHHRG